METQTAVLKREVPFTFPLEIYKQGDEAGEFHIVGYAATVDFDRQGDILTGEALKAAAADLLKNSTVLLNHDLKHPIGRVTSVKFDKRGILIDALISSTEPEVIQKIKEGVLNKFSIRGQVLERERKWLKEEERVVNVIKRVTLSEVSIVSVPANPEAKAVGWYISKALMADNPDPEGGTDMDDKDKPADGAAPPQSADAPAAAAEPDKGKDTTPSTGQPAAAPEAAQAPAAEPAPAAPEESPDGIEKALHQVLAQQLAPAFGLLDRLIAMPNEEVKLKAREIKAMLMRLLGEDGPLASGAGNGTMASKEDVGALVQQEVEKQLKKAMDAVPTLRKGLAPIGRPADGGGDDEVIKAFEKLEPSAKLRTLLTIEHGRRDA